MRAGGIIALILALSAGMAEARAPETSIRPQPRPIAGNPLPEVPLVYADPSGSLSRASVRPRPRPTQSSMAPEAVASAEAVVPPEVEQPKRRGLAALFRPGNRSADPSKTAPERRLLAAAVRPNPGQDTVKSRKGAVCGDPAIKGKTLAPIPAKLKGCGISDPVQVTSVDGVQLSVAATLDCTTAKALKTWVADGLKPAFGRNQVVGLEVAAHYACRGQNNKKGAPVSEHGRGKAIDISGVILANGKTVTVERDWRRRDGKAIKRAYQAGCGIFGTTLGPGSDGYHEDHMHFDTASHRNGSYCR